MSNGLLLLLLLGLLRLLLIVLAQWGCLEFLHRKDISSCTPIISSLSSVESRRSFEQNTRVPAS